MYGYSRHEDFNKNNDTTYPQIYFPISLSNAMKDDSPPYVAPKSPKKNYEVWGELMVMIIIIFLSGGGLYLIYYQPDKSIMLMFNKTMVVIGKIISFGMMDGNECLELLNFYFKLFLWPIFVFFTLLGPVGIINQFIERKKEYIKDQKKYETACDDYNKKIEPYNRMSHDEKISFKMQQAIKELSPKYPIQCIEYVPTQGISEAYGWNTIFKRLNDDETICDGVSVRIPIQKQRILRYNDIKNYYYPDFVVKGKHNNIIIDVEIDEPYNIQGDPIHYDDNIRNSLFLFWGWGVIRFSEEQIVRWPDYCYKVIKDYYHAILDKKCYDNFDFTQHELPRWDKEMAEKYFQNKYRNTYLSRYLE